MVLSGRNILACEAWNIFSTEYSATSMLFGSGQYWGENASLGKLVEIDPIDVVMSYGIVGIQIVYGFYLATTFKCAARSHCNPFRKYILFLLLGHEEPHDYYKYTEFALRRFVSISGLTLIRLVSLGGAPEVMMDIFSKTILGVPKLGGVLSSFGQCATGWFLGTRLGNICCMRMNRKFPLGYGLIATKPN